MTFGKVEVDLRAHLGVEALVHDTSRWNRLGFLAVFFGKVQGLRKGRHVNMDFYTAEFA